MVADAILSSLAEYAEPRPLLSPVAMGPWTAREMSGMWVRGGVEAWGWDLSDLAARVFIRLWPQKERHGRGSDSSQGMVTLLFTDVVQSQGPGGLLCGHWQAVGLLAEVLALSPLSPGPARRVCLHVCPSLAGLDCMSSMETRVRAGPCCWRIPAHARWPLL